MSLTKGIQQIQSLQSRSEKNASERNRRHDSRRSFDLGSIFGQRDRVGKLSKEIEQHAQDQHEKRQRFEEETETDVFMTSLEGDRIIIEDATQVRAIDHFRETAKFNAVNALDSIETLGDYYVKFRTRIQHNFKGDESTGEELIEDGRRILRRASDYWATLAVGPKLQRSMHGMGELGQ